MQSYIFWALLGMVGYSFTTLFTKLAERNNEVSDFMVLAISATIVSIFVLAVVAIRGELRPLIYDLEKGMLAWAAELSLRKCQLQTSCTSPSLVAFMHPASILVAFPQKRLALSIEQREDRDDFCDVSNGRVNIVLVRRMVLATHHSL